MPAGLLRWAVRFGLLVAGVVLLSGCLTDGNRLVVNTGADGADAAPGDGVCEMTAGARDCSLRAAIDEANTSRQILLITVPAGVTGLTLTGVDDGNATGDLDVAPASGWLTIRGVGAGAAIEAAGADGIIDVRSGRVQLERVGVRNSAGDGITARSGTEVVLARSASTGHSDAGLFVEAGASAVAQHATLSHNSTGVHDNGTFEATYATITANTNGGIQGTAVPQLAATIVADQLGGPDCGQAATSAGYNLTSDGTCALGAPSDLTGPAALEPLRGLVGFHHPTPASLAIDSVTAATHCGPSLVDQRNQPRPDGPACDRGAIEADFILDLTVDDDGDTRDVDPGDRVCLDLAGACTLRAALDETNAAVQAGPHVITLATDPSLSILGKTDDANAGGDLDVTKSVTIQGAGHTIDANGVDRVLDHHPTGELTIVDTTITGGSSPTALPSIGSAGAGIRAEAPLVLVGSVVTGNTTASALAHGAGIYSAVSLDLEATRVVSNTVLAFPQGAVEGGGVFARGIVRIRDSEIASNRAEGGHSGGLHGIGGGVALRDATADITTTSFSGNVATGWNEFSAPELAEHLSGGGGIAAHQSTLDVSGSEFRSNQVLGANFPTSPTMPRTLPGYGGGIAATSSSVTVEDTLVIDNDAAGGGGAFVSGAGGSGGGISVANSSLIVENSSLSGNQARSSFPPIFTEAGSGAGLYAIHDSTVTIFQSTLQNGLAESGGGMTLRNGSSLAMSSSTISGNTALFYGGGAIDAVGAASATLTQSTISGNESPTGAAVSGGATLVLSTVAGNTGGVSLSGPVNARGTVISTDGPTACSAPITSGGHNLVSDASCAVGATGDVQGVSALLGPLQDNGGPTFTHLPDPGSPARDSIPVGTPGLCDGALPADQRGVARPQGPACDRGSVEQ